MFCYHTTIKLRDTDATGVLFFTEQLRLALDVFDAYLLSTDSSLSQFLEAHRCLMPIVHAEADYIFPLRLSDKIEIRMAVEKIGASSFTLVYHFFNSLINRLAGKVKIVHVCTNKETGEKMSLPDQLIQQLRAMPQEPLVVAGQV